VPGPAEKERQTWDASWNTILWRQFGAAIDVLENAMNACPDESWSDPSRRPEWVRRTVVGFWHVAYHTLFFLDLQLAGSAEGWAVATGARWGSLDLSFCRAAVLQHAPRAAQLNFLLLQHTDSAPGWVKRTELPLNAG
jgi:hypothetical protein